MSHVQIEPAGLSVCLSVCLSAMLCLISVDLVY